VPDGKIVFVVDDDDSVRRALARRLRVAGYAVNAFASAKEFLEQAPADGVACVVTDLRMPGMSGLDLQASLAASGRDWPIVFVSGHGDVPTSVSAMRSGAVHFLAKPVSARDLLAAVAEALAIGVHRAHERSSAARVSECYAALTAREREVFALVVEGLMNKVIAERIGAAEKTVKIHRARVMAKMGARSVADLVRMAARLPPPSGV
jgi:FixJ family two-component response regulator